MYCVFIYLVDLQILCVNQAWKSHYLGGGDDLHQSLLNSRDVQRSKWSPPVLLVRAAWSVRCACCLPGAFKACLPIRHCCPGH
ncbi:hypothetical protein FKM82_009751 [Ascaphus truei]